MILVRVKPSDKGQKNWSIPNDMYEFNHHDENLLQWLMYGVYHIQNPGYNNINLTYLCLTVLSPMSVDICIFYAIQRKYIPLCGLFFIYKNLHLIRCIQKENNHPQYLLRAQHFKHERNPIVKI